MTVILVFLLSLSASAQSQYEYRLEGSFRTESDLTAGPATVNYSISWNESGETIQGIYQDNYFTQGQPRVIAGDIDDEGREFTAILPETTFGVESITFTTPRREVLTGSIPMRVVTEDAVGGVINTENTFALMSVLTTDPEAPFTDNDQCSIGFGALTGYCGLYGGTISEVVDSGNRCNLVQGNTMLQMSFDTVFRLYLNYVPGVPDQPMHLIGAFPPTPLSNSVNVTGRTCGPLDGTNFAPNCKVMNLSGIFFEQTPTILFTGTYSITDEVTGETCSYSMSVQRRLLL